jgi:hypothetical protein
MAMPHSAAISSVMSLGAIVAAWVAMMARASSFKVVRTGGGGLAGNRAATPPAATFLARRPTVFAVHPERGGDLEVVGKIRPRQRGDRQVPANLVVDVEHADRHRAGEDPHLVAEAPHHQARSDGDPLGWGDLDQGSPVLFLRSSRRGLHRPNYNFNLKLSSN